MLLSRDTEHLAYELQSKKLSGCVSQSRFEPEGMIIIIFPEYLSNYLGHLYMK